MLTDFILAVALICPDANVVHVQEVLTPKPITYKECNKRTEDPELRKKFRRETLDSNGCEQDLICVRVLWGDAQD